MTNHTTLEEARATAKKPSVDGEFYPITEATKGDSWAISYRRGIWKQFHAKMELNRTYYIHIVLLNKIVAGLTVRDDRGVVLSEEWHAGKEKELYTVATQLMSKVWWSLT